MEDETEEEGELEVYASGNKRWLDKEGRFHRLNGPAIIYFDGDTYWYKHGKLHRDDGPAVEWPSDGTEEWYKDGEEYEPSAHELMVWKMKQKKKES
jgi:hypothetical protein